MNDYKCQPLNIKQIREIAKKYRTKLKLTNKEPFPVLEFMEIIYPASDPKFIFHVEEKKNMKGIHGLTDHDKHMVQIREDVYDGAMQGHGRDRLTIMHEFFHYISHDGIALALYRIDEGEIVKPWEDCEWQANCFGGEILVPPEGIIGMTVKDVCENYKVSPAAARRQLLRASKL